MRASTSQRVCRGLSAAVLLAASTHIARGSDHSDAPLTAVGPRPDANITDLHAFLAGGDLVLSVCTNPMIPTGATSYRFPTDVIFEINIDVDSAVDPADPMGDGGTVVHPELIREDVVFRIRFDDDGAARVRRIGGHASDDDRTGNDPSLVGFFAGLRDDPFIRGPRQRRNVGAIVLELPLASVIAEQSTLLIWATSQVEDVEGPFQEIAGRSLKSMFPENAALNGIHPRQHLRATGISPDVMIFDTARPAGFPNGRLLTDDVVNLVGDLRILNSDAPFPSENDLPFLATFPYLAAPHPAY